MGMGGGSGIVVVGQGYGGRRFVGCRGIEREYVMGCWMGLRNLAACICYSV